MLKITAYAERLINDLDTVDFIERVKTQQKNWIGRSTGAEVHFTTSPGDVMTVFTTRPDTLFGATYMVMSPEHPFLEKWTEAGLLSNVAELRAYQEAAAHKSDFERTEMNKDKTGLRLEGVSATNPATGQAIPIFISDYVLSSYGTGAIMAVPGHDERDWDFATKFGCPIVEVVDGGDVATAAHSDIETGVMVNSDFLNGLSVADAKVKITNWLIDNGLGCEKVNYKLRDWVFSRQRYWGEPIPIVHCEHCGHVPLDEAELPLTLPEVESYEPTENGESPLAKLTDWVNTTCPSCGGPAQRETDTMPQWAGSSWYFLRYTDPHNDKAFASPEALAYWTPVNWYNGGMEHTTLHLLYSRFWHKFLFDIGVVPSSEPYAKRTSHGMILGENNEKMSKSRGNVVNPDDIISQYGADTMRLYEMFIGDFEKPAPWNPQSIKGCYRFVERFWALQDILIEGASIRPELLGRFHKTIKKIGEDIMNLKNNTAIAALMTLINSIYELGSITREELRIFLLLLSPFAPHVVEEIWENLAMGEGFACAQAWPQYDPELCKDATVEIAIQVNGKIKARLNIAADAVEAVVLEAAQSDAHVQAALAGKTLLKALYVKGRLVNLVVK